jgi:hypothetical protein
MALPHATMPPKPISFCRLSEQAAPKNQLAWDLLGASNGVAVSPSTECPAAHATRQGDTSQFLR